MAKLPADVHKLRSSERKTFKTCPQQWWWSYVEGLRSTGAESTALWFGTGMHLVWAEWYIPGSKRGRDPHETWEEWCGPANVDKVKIDTPEEYGIFVDAKELGHIMIDEYLKLYGNDDHLIVIASELRFRAILPHPNDFSRPYVDMVGTTDCIVRDQTDGLVKLMDHKHMAQLKLAHLSLDEQLGGYVSVAEHTLKRDGLINKTDRIDGIWYNVLVKAKPDNRPRDNEGRYRNQPIKKDYVQSLIDLYVASGDAQDFADDNGVTVAEQIAIERKRLAKLTLPGLKEEAEDLALTVFGDISKRQGTRHFAREFVPFTRRQKMRQIKRIGEDMVQMNMVRDGQLAVMKSPADHCAWCQFRELCELDEIGGDTEEFKQMVFNKTDPYADHRDGAENSKTSVLLKRKTGVS